MLKKIVPVLGVLIIVILTFSYAFKETNKISTRYLSENAPANVSNQAGPPVSSGPVVDVPWLNDESFQKAQAQYNTPVQLAAFCTVLHDPLPGEEHNVHRAAEILAGTVVKPGKIFSMNNTIGPYKGPKGFQAGPVYIGSELRTTVGGGVCKMASTLYNVAILSNLPVVERHPHSMPVPYVPLGQDATVSTGVADIRFKNDRPTPILIWSQGVDNRLYVAFYGQEPAPVVEWHHEILEKYSTRVVYRHNPSLPKGTEKVVVQGMDGALVKTWITIKNGDGTTIVKQLGVDSYKPLPTVVERHKG